MRVTRTLFLIAMLSTIVATAAFAQKIQLGSIVLLRAPSGLYLSAHPVETLVLSPNAAAWEQWEIVQDGNGTTFQANRETYLRSFHGTRIALENKWAATARAYHAPASAWDKGSLQPVSCVKGADGAEVTNYLPGGVAQSGYDNTKVVIMDVPNSFIVENPNGALGLSRWEVRENQELPPAACFTMQLVRSPAPGRSPKLNAVYRNSRYHLRSHSNTQLTLDQTKGLVADLPFIHMRPDLHPGWWLDFRFYSPSSDEKTPLLWGDRLEIVTEPFGRGTWPLTVHQGSVMSKSGVKTIWTFVDPTKRYADGTRIPAGANIVLHSDFGNLSANPAVTAVHLSPNASEWEWWRPCGAYDIPCN